MSEEPPDQPASPATPPEPTPPASPADPTTVNPAPPAQPGLDLSRARRLGRSDAAPRRTRRLGRPRGAAGRRAATGQPGSDRRLGARRTAARGRARPVLRGHDLAPRRLRDRPDPHRHRRRHHRGDPRGGGELFVDPVRALRGRLPAVRSGLHHPRGRPEPRLLRVLLVGRPAGDDRPAHLRDPGRQRVRRTSAVDRAGAAAMGRPRPVPRAARPRPAALVVAGPGPARLVDRPVRLDRARAPRTRASTTSSPTRRSSGRPGRDRAGWRSPARSSSACSCSSRSSASWR